MTELFAMEYVGCYVRESFFDMNGKWQTDVTDIEGKKYKRCINTVENAMFVNTIIINGYKR